MIKLISLVPLDKSCTPGKAFQDLWKCSKTPCRLSLLCLSRNTSFPCPGWLWLSRGEDHYEDAGSLWRTLFSCQRRGHLHGVHGTRSYVVPLTTVLRFCNLHRGEWKSRDTKYFAQGHSTGWGSKLECWTTCAGPWTIAAFKFHRRSLWLSKRIQEQISAWPMYSSWIQRCSQTPSLPHWLMHDYQIISECCVKFFINPEINIQFDFFSILLRMYSFLRHLNISWFPLETLKEKLISSFLI